jgi:hypothetical protein
MNVSSFLGYCAGIPYVMKDKLSDAMAEERLINTQNMDEQETTQRQAVRTTNQNATALKFNLNNLPAGSLLKAPPTNPANNPDLLSRMVDNAAAQAADVQNQSALAQLQRQLSQLSTAMPKNMAMLVAQIANQFFGAKQAQEEDLEVKSKRKDEDELAEQENPSLLLVDVTSSTGVGPFNSRS